MNLGETRFLRRRPNGQILGFWSGGGGGAFTAAEHGPGGTRVLTRLDHAVPDDNGVNVFIGMTN